MVIRGTWVDFSLRRVRASVSGARPLLGFALKWLLRSIVGLLGGAIAGGLVGLPVGLVAWGLDNSSYAFLWMIAMPVLGVVLGGGIGIGVAHWRVLRVERIRRAGWWVLAHTLRWGAGTAVGVAVGVAVGLSVGFYTHYRWAAAVGLFVGFTVAGLVGGALQWLVLRGQVPGAARWVLASTIGYALGGALVAVAVMPSAAGGSVLIAVFGVVTAAATSGGALGWLLGARDTEPAAGRIDL